MKKTMMIFAAIFALGAAGCSDTSDNGPKYVISVLGDANGAASANVVKAKEGTTVKLTATPNDGYKFSKWVVVSGDVTFADETANPATFTMPGDGVEFRAEFVESFQITRTYKGTLSVSGENDNIYTQENVTAIFTFDEGMGMADIKMLQVKFSPNMPISIDMTIPGITATQNAEAISFNGTQIIPTVGEGPFPMYTITDLGGHSAIEDISLEMICGSYPTSFIGIAVPVR